jgi:hypothetical protein
MSDTEKEYICSLCGEVWTTLPEDAVPLTNFGGRGRANTYRFSDGTIHVIRIKARSARGEKQ